MTDLTDRMRTCAAFIMGRPHDAPMPTEHLLDDAARLLVAAADEIDALTGPIDLGEPMEVIPPIVTQNTPLVQDMSVGQWVSSGDAIVSNPYRGRHTCPKCDSRAGKTVHKKDKQIWLECPACGTKWRI